MRSFMTPVKAAGMLLLICSAVGFYQGSTNSSRVKCLIQTTNYEGEGAYIVVSLIDPSGNYEKTLYMQGQDPQWYPTLTRWWEKIGKNEKHIDAVSGATKGAGARTVCSFEVDQSKINSGYTIRFESAVEDQEYYEKDLELPLNKENLQGQFEGKGYIRYIRLMTN